MSEAPGLAVRVEVIESTIVVIRGHNVMLDSDLADLYQVEVRALNQAVRRNIERFPSDFMFQLTAAEAESLRSQTVTLKSGRGQRRKYAPYAFTEQGVDAIRKLMAPSPPAIRRLGYPVKQEE